MRIIAGAWRGRPLAAPAGRATRPTADRVRETLFSMLVSRLGAFEGLGVADLFAGSGALGFEALSRGADSAVFVETDRAAVAAIETNARTFGVGDRVELRRHSALTLPPGPRFDLILGDPPYELGSGTQLVAAVAAAEWLAPGGWLAVETAKGEPVEPGPYALDAGRDVGRARITLLRA